MALNYVAKFTADTSQHDAALKKSAKQVYDYKKGVEGAKNGLSGMMKKIGPLAAQIGIASGALATFKKALVSTEAGTDAFNRAMDVAKASVHDFFSSLTNGVGISSFLQNLADIKDAAIEAYNALDDLGTMKMWNKTRIETLKAQIAEDRVVVYSDKSSAKEKQAASNRIEINQQKINALNGNVLDATQNAYYAMIRKFAGGYKISNETADWLMRQREAGTLDDYIKQYDKTHKTKKGIVGGSTGGSVTGYVPSQTVYTYNTKGEENWANAMKAFQGATDEEIQQILALANEEAQIRQEQAAEQLRSERIIKKGTASTNNKKTSEDDEEKYAEGTIGYYEKQISDLKKKMLETTDNAAYAALEAEVDRIQALIDQIKGIKEEVKENTNFSVESSGMFSTYADYDAMIKQFEDAQKITDDTFESIYGGISGVASAFTSLGSSIAKIFDNDEIQQYIDNLTSILSVMDGMYKAYEAIKELQETLNTLKAAHILLEQQDTAVTAADAAANAADGSAKAGSAIAGATSSGASLPFPYNLVAIAAGVAAVIGALAMMGKYANGGIVGGGSPVGDSNLVRVNSGEMILNGTQQANLFRMLNGIGTPSKTSSENVTFKISGSDLVGTIENYNRKYNKVK